MVMMQTHHEFIDPQLLFLVTQYYYLDFQLLASGFSPQLESLYVHSTQLSGAITYCDTEDDRGLFLFASGAHHTDELLGSAFGVLAFGQVATRAAGATTAAHQGSASLIASCGTDESLFYFGGGDGVVFPLFSLCSAFPVLILNSAASAKSRTLIGT